jgi:hypothetical protein
MFDGMEPATRMDPRAGERSYYQRRKAARRAAGLDPAFNGRAMAKKLVQDAAASVDLRPDRTGRSNIIRLMCEMYLLNGESLNWHRGWVDAFRDLFASRGLTVPNPKVCRTYRSRLSESAMLFATTPLVDVSVLERIEARYLRA